MQHFTRFDLEQAEKLINNGFDGSNANRHSLEQAQKLLRSASQWLQNFADKKPGTLAAIACNNQAQHFLDVANKVKL